MKLTTRIKNRIKLKKALNLYRDYYYEYGKELRKLIWYYKEKRHKRIAVWGAGLMGTAYLYTIDHDHSRIEYVIDINECLHGTKTPSGHNIGSVNELEQYNVEIIFVMSHLLYGEIYTELKELEKKVCLIDIDEMILSQKKVEDIIHEEKRNMVN